ncbi:hypothetical protein OHA33_12260 [Streptomyces sp. NBC_00562]|uniref:hypothetical protein n=1 Tax=Streptomyces sp. NBC_00562 TaxID=2975777 RepID=UPI002E80C6C9|nr:hypothetical protein [Streptomyces sp. NBC_00562]WUC19583.1 hypothetical protein OHA33_12260 [Streptomyces sp. NBC_00562]
MRLIGMPAVAGAVVLALSAHAAMAGADADPTATVSPNTVQPGQTVQLTLRNCENPGEGGLAEGSLVGGETTARSPIGITELKAGADGTLVGTATIENAERGTMGTIYLACNSNPDKVVETTVTITR